MIDQAGKLGFYFVNVELLQGSLQVASPPVRAARVAKPQFAEYGGGFAIAPGLRNKPNPVAHPIGRRIWFGDGGP
jgi:hypothetical protein